MRLNGKDIYLSFLKGQGFEHKGEYSSTAVYEKTNQRIDCFEYQGTSYYTKQTAPAGTLPTNTTYFGVLALGGGSNKADKNANNLTNEDVASWQNKLNFSSKANLDASNLSSGNITSWRSKLDVNRTAITINRTSNIVASTTGTQKAGLNYIFNSINLGSKLSLSNNSVLIGSGVSKVMVSAQASFYVDYSGENKFYIYKNSTAVSNAIVGIKTSAEVYKNQSISMTPFVLNVSAGDTISLYYNVPQNQTILCNTNQAYTCLTVEVLE